MLTHRSCPVKKLIFMEAQNQKGHIPPETYKRLLEVLHSTNLNSRKFREVCNSEVVFVPEEGGYRLIFGEQGSALRRAVQQKRNNLIQARRRRGAKLPSIASATAFSLSSGPPGTPPLTAPFSTPPLSRTKQEALQASFPTPSPYHFSSATIVRKMRRASQNSTRQLTLFDTRSRNYVLLIIRR